jgi:Fe-S cluster biogenesis protein NfuA
VSSAGSDATPPDALDIGEAGAHIAALLDRLAGTGPEAAATGEALVRALLGLYGAGLDRILTALQHAAPEALLTLAEDPLVAGLLALHDLHPRTVRQRVEAALEGVRPYLASHGGDVSVLSVEDGVVRLRLEGTCNGCGSSQATLEHAVEGAVAAAAPEVEHIEVEGVATPPDPHDGLIPLESLLRCPTEVEELLLEKEP